ncbi:uncharacterized protein [Dendrobates tinctorius]|uniref:uncharacterized protein n=1 Tax=Dendrobates tinctorius TaxID=92724 RepID=UPI003CCA3873
MKDRFNTDVRAEGQVRSGSAARTRTKYRYHRALEFLRPVLATRATRISTLQPVPGAVLHRSTSDPSQPSDSQEANGRSATQTAGDQEAGQSGVPLSQVSVTGCAGTTRQQQRASDRPVLPEFMHLSDAFHASLKTLSERVESGFSLMEHGFNHMEHLFLSSDQRLEWLETDLNRPAHHFFSKIERGMADHLSTEQQLNVLHACNTAFLQAMQQNQYVQQSVLSFPPMPPLSLFTTVPTSAAYHCTATCIPSQAGHHYTTPMPSAAGHSTPATTMSSAAPVWSTSTAIVTSSWHTTSPKSAWSTTTSSPVQSTESPSSPGRSSATSHHYESTGTNPQHSRSTSTTHQRSTATTSPPRSTATTTLHRSTATASPPHSTASTPHQKSTATTSPDRSTATTSPTRSPTHTSPSLSTVTTISPSRSIASTTTEQSRGDPHSVFYSAKTRSTISSRSANVRRPYGVWSRQVTPAPKKKKKKRLC